MPLTKRQFELRIDPEMEAWMRQVYKLLASDRNLAYSSEELFGAVVANDPDKEDKFDRALNVLAKIGAVEKRQVYEKDFYAFSEAFDTDSWEPKVLPF